MKWWLALLSGLMWVNGGAATPLEVVEVTGNGRITAGLDATGRLTQLRWPTLGYWEHMGAPAGAGWWLVDGAECLPFTADDWHITQRRNTDGSVTTVYAAREDGRRATQHLSVLRDADVVVVQLVLEEFSTGARIFWSQHMMPSTHLVNGVPDGYHRFPQSTGFVTAFDPVDGTLLSFRPQAPGKEDWRRARRLAASVRSSTAWSSFNEGAYWGTFSPAGLRSGYCVTGDDGRPVIASPGAGQTLPAVVGAAHGILEPLVETTAAGTQQFTLCLAVASSEPALQALRTRLLEKGVPNRPTPQAATDDASATYTLSSLLACVDPSSGSILRAPISTPALAHASVFNTAWTTAALDRFGYTIPAQRALEFHRETVQRTYGADGMPGSLPAFVHSTGQSADFQDRANPSSTAWLLAALWRHVAGLEPEMANALLKEWEDVLRQGGDFLARAPVVGAVLSGTMKPIAASLAELETHYLGLVSARLLLEELGETEPTHWQQRREETYARIRFRQLDGVEEEASRWLDAWVRHLPDEAKAESGVWDVLKLPQEGPVRLPAALRGIATGVPVSLRAALTLLETDYEM